MERILPRARRGALGLLLACLFAFFWRLGSVPLFDLDEALYVACAKQMALSGDIVTPRLNSRPSDRFWEKTVPFFEKPILVYWVSAASMKAFGISEWAARLSSAFAALLTTGVIAGAGRRWFGHRAGLLAGLVFATAPMTITDARQMTTDGLLVLWVALAMAAFWFCLKSAESHASLWLRWRWPLLFWLACTLAVLTKGVVGLLLPGLVLAVFLLLAARVQGERGVSGVLSFGWRSARKLRPLAGLLMLIALAAPWHIAIARRGERDAQGRTWVQEYVIRQHIGRFRGGDKWHNAPLPSYVAFFLVGFFPWACFVPAAFRFPRTKPPGGRLSPAEAPDGLPSSRAHSSFSASDSGQKETLPGPVPAEKAETPAPQHPTPDTYPEAETHRFLLVWFWTIFVFFSLGAAKLPTYIAPAYPAAALLVGKWLDRALRVAAGAREKRALLWGGIAATATAALLAAAVTIAPAFVPPSSPLPAPIARLALALTLTLLVGCAAACAYFSIGYIGKSSATARKAGVAALALTMLAFVGVASGPGYDAARKYVLGPYQYLALLARMKAPDGWPIVFYHIIPRRPSMLYYAPYSPLERKETPLLPFLRDFLPADTLNVIVITSRRSWEQELQPELAAAPEFTARLLAETGAETGGGWVMLRLQTRPPPQ